MNGAALPLIVGAIVSLAAIASATVALVTGHLDQAGFLSIVSVFGGAGVGVTAHAAGTKA